MNTQEFWIQGRFPAPDKVERIVSFGDSLSDTGFSQGHGFGRYSNGPTWVEYLAQRLGASLLCRAWGGARTDQGNCSGPPDWSGLAWQIGKHEVAADPKATLYTILAGVNDLFDGKGEPTVTAGRVAAACDRLLEQGAQQVLVLTMPDLSRAPAYITQQEYQGLLATVRGHTAAANQELRSLLAVRPCLVFDAAGLWEALQDTVYADTHRAWLGSYRYPDPCGSFWWDDWHPMTSVHERMAAAVGGWA